MHSSCMRCRRYCSTYKSQANEKQGILIIIRALQSLIASPASAAPRRIFEDLCQDMKIEVRDAEQGADRPLLELSQGTQSLISMHSIARVSHVEGVRVWVPRYEPSSPEDTLS